jgi:hypothetical protein
MRKLQGHTRSSLSEYIFFIKKQIDNWPFRDFPLAWYSDLLGVLEFSAILKNIFTINEAIVYFRLSGQNITSKTIIVNKKIYRYLCIFYYLIDKKLVTLMSQHFTA